MYKHYYGSGTRIELLDEDKNVLILVDEHISGCSLSGYTYANDIKAGFGMSWSSLWATAPDDVLAVIKEHGRTECPDSAWIQKLFGTAKTVETSEMVEEVEEVADAAPNKHGKRPRSRTPAEVVRTSCTIQRLGALQASHITTYMLPTPTLVERLRAQEMPNDEALAVAIDEWKRLLTGDVGL